MQGDADSERFMYGSRVLVRSPPGLPRAQLHFDNVELARMGQAFRLGRYAVHFQWHGDASKACWLRSCSIHHTYSRALGVQGTQRLMIQNNVAYSSMGHAFFLEVRACMPPGRIVLSPRDLLRVGAEVGHWLPRPGAAADPYAQPNLVVLVV
jgi:hypothetical protein